MSIAKKGDWVLIEKIVLEPEQRSENLPTDTKKCPLVMRTKGYLLENSNIGDIVSVKTLTGRVVEGKLIGVNPRYIHDYGECVPELLRVGKEARQILFRSDN